MFADICSWYQNAVVHSALAWLCPGTASAVWGGFGAI